jgi:DNA-binding MarR family transcriptional regulator
LVRGKDEDFRRMVDRMVQFSVVLQRIREGLARGMGVSPPQYSMLMHLARSENGALTTSQVAESLDVTLAFVVTESNKLAAKGLVERRRNPQDARSVFICLTAQGRRTISEAAPIICKVNDLLFRSLSRDAMQSLADTHASLLDSADKAMAFLSNGSR